MWWRRSVFASSWLRGRALMTEETPDQTLTWTQEEDDQASTDLAQAMVQNNPELRAAVEFADRLVRNVEGWGRQW